MPYLLPARLTARTRPSLPRPHGPDTVEIPFTYEGYLIAVEGKINGQSAKLILDTGAGAGLYTPKSAEKLQLKTMGQTLVGGGGERLIPAKITTTRIELGEAVQENQLGVILELPSGAKGEYDGIVGYPFFKNYVVQFDYAAQRVRFIAPAHFTPEPGAVALPMNLRMNIPEIPGKIDGLAGALRVDTGFSGALTFTSPTVQKNALAKKYAKRIETILGQGVGGVTTGEVTRIGALELGNVKVKGIVTGLSADKSGALADTGTIALLGGEVLSRFTVTIDYPGKRFFLRPNADLSKPFVFSRSGLAGIFEGEGYKVMTVVPGGPAESVGIKVGDTVTALGDEPTKGMGLSRSRELFRQAAGTPVRVRVRTGGEPEREVVLVLKDVL